MNDNLYALYLPVPYDYRTFKFCIECEKLKSLKEFRLMDDIIESQWTGIVPRSNRCKECSVCVCKVPKKKNKLVVSTVNIDLLPTKEELETMTDRQLRRKFTC